MQTPVTPHGAVSAAQAVSARFADRPSLEAVIRQQLAAALEQRYPTLTVDLTRTQLAVPQRRGWLLQPLMSVVQDALASGATLDFSDVNDRPYYLCDDPPERLKLPGVAREKLAMPTVAALIGELPQTLPVALQDALAAYWDGGDGASRWRWLAEVLLDTLRINALRQTGLDVPTRQTIDQLVCTPDREQRIARHGQNAVYAYCLDTTLKSGERAVSLLGPEIVLARSFNGNAAALLCSPHGGIEAFASMDALIHAFGQRLGHQYEVDDIVIARYEPEGNIFDQQAAMILNRQLDDLGNLRFPSGQPFSAWQALYREISDPGRLFLDVPAAQPLALAALRRQLPGWLQRASADDQATYRRHSLALASAKQRGEGRTFLSDIDDIRSFTVKALLQALQHDAVAFDKIELTPPAVRALHPDDLQLTFSITAGYPGTIGVTRHERMSLTDLAINNLSSRPSGTVTLANRHGLALPAWLTADYLMKSGGLIERVDIGQHYPRLLNEQLLGDSAQARQRETLFADQQSAHLPLLALELCLKHQSGLSRQGARLVAALMQVDGADQQVDKRNVVIRHLALLRTPGALPDIVNNMYLIEVEDTRVGPHLLYRPLYAEVFQEFSSRQALFDTIAQAGPLQDSVLTWLKDSARPIYANGGFIEPHYLRFGQGDEFAPLDKPKPASLSIDGINDELRQCLITGRLMPYLFSDHARALVAQADRESVSNSESRWQVLLEGGSLLFSNLLLPLFRGPTMLTGWLVALTASLSQDVPALNAEDSTARELAAVDLLLNLSLILLEALPAALAPMLRLPGLLTNQVLAPLAARRVAEQWPVPAAPIIREGAVALAGMLAQVDKSVIDFSFSQARQRLTPAQRLNLAGFKAVRPTPLPLPVLNGPRKGLYVLENTWHALANGEWLQVVLEPQGDVRVVAPGDASRRGPYLRSEADGVWSVDTRLRLRGGLPPRRVAAERQRRAERSSQLQNSYQQFVLGQTDRQRRVDIALSVMENTASDPRYTEAQRNDNRHRFDATLLEQTQEYQQQLDGLKERNELAIPLPPHSVAALLENLVNNARKHVVVAETDRQSLYRTESRFNSNGAGFAEAIASDFPGYQRFLLDTIAINDRSMHWLELRDRYLDQLFNLGSAGSGNYSRLTDDRPREVSSLAVKELQMRSLELMSHKNPEHPLVTVLGDLLDPIQEHVRTHSELNALELTSDERISVLESLVEHYGRCLDSVQGVGIVNADELENAYFSRLLKLLGELYLDAAQQLAIEIKPLVQLVRRPSRRSPTAAGKPLKKIIRTRKKGTFIGEVKPLGTLETVEVRSEVNDKLLGMYSQSGDQWVEFNQAPPPAPPKAPRSLSLVKGEARKLLVMLEEHLARGDQYRKISRHPQEVQEVLQYESVRYDRLATELHQAIQAQPAETRAAADQTLEADMRQAAVRLSERGQALRIQLSLELAPTHGNIEYLIEQKQVNMALLGERIQLSGERRDFVQEYALNDAKGYPLWYAHFHYSSADTPKTDYTAAHLKTREQRKQSYYALLARAQSPQAVVDVHRGLIGKQLAERWFLPLAT